MVHDLGVYSLQGLGLGQGHYSRRCLLFRGSLWTIDSGVYSLLGRVGGQGCFSLLIHMAAASTVTEYGQARCA